MIYNLEFKPKAIIEWNKLNNSTRNQFKNNLNKRLENPKIQKDKISGYKNLYKIKLRSAGYRLIYEVKEAEIIVLVLSIGKR